MASVSGSSTQSADSSASQKSDVWNFGQKKRNVCYVQRSSHFIVWCTVEQTHILFTCKAIG